MEFRTNFDDAKHTKNYTKITKSPQLKAQILALLRTQLITHITNEQTSISAKSESAKSQSISITKEPKL